MLQLTLLLAIIIAALVLFIGGWLAVDLVGLLVLAALALTGLVDPAEALAGFSSAAVVTVWAMFIISAGLLRTGVAYSLGQPLQRFVKSREWILVAVLMTTASLLSALINTISVAAILLPATMDLARRSGRPPSRLLLPMALGCLLGGPFTGISTPPNILVTDALKSSGLVPFGIFDFTPITGVIVITGISFVAFVGLRFLPKADPQAQDVMASVIKASYQLDTHVFSLAIRPGSPLAGHTLSKTRLGTALYLTVVALKRKGEMRLAPGPSERLQEGDILLVHGSAEHFRRFQGRQHLRMDLSNQAASFISCTLLTASGVIGRGSPLLGVSLGQSALRREHQVHVLSVETADRENDQNLLHHPLEQGDVLVFLGTKQALDNIARLGLVERLDILDREEEHKGLRGKVFMSVEVPAGSILVDHNLTESRLGHVFGLTVVGIVRGGKPLCMPAPTEIVQEKDTLIVHGDSDDLEVLQGLEELVVSETSPSLVAELESQQVGVTEVLLSPRTTLTGKTLAD